MQTRNLEKTTKTHQKNQIKLVFELIINSFTTNL